MKANEATIKLIGEFEGLELKAYPDPATGDDPWTIGYGHTSAAGMPSVKPGMKITKSEATGILMKDLMVFEDGVERLLKREINENQFGALVSFAYNAGLGNLKKSSVLTAVNSGDFASVPRRLMMWNKAAGKVMPGLSRRRAAEGNLFMTPTGVATLFSDGHAGLVPDEPESGKSLGQSSTVWTAVAAGGGGAMAAGKEAVAQVRETGDLFGFTGQALFWLCLVALIGGCAFWIVRERMKKSRNDGI
jgi:lysozyme